MPSKKDESIAQSSLIAKALKLVRQSAGLRQIDVSQASGLSKAMVSAYEGGKALPSVLSLCRYLNAIGRDFGDLQNALDEMGGIPCHRVIEAEIMERKVGRVVLGLLQSMGIATVNEPDGAEGAQTFEQAQLNRAAVPRARP
jgi:transcriptional regulator with XRE-family HTH domain